MSSLNSRIYLACLALVVTGAIAGPAQAAGRKPSVKRLDAPNFTASELVRQAYNSMKTGDWDKALQLFRAASRKEPANFMIRRYMAYAMLQQGLAGEALEQLKMIGSYKQSTAYDFFLTGLALDGMNDPRNAAQYYVYAVDEEPANTFYRNKAIDALKALSLYDDATDLINEGLAMTSDPNARNGYKVKLSQVESSRKLVNVQITCHQAAKN